MNILLLGSGGREHALAWKITQSPLCKRLYIAPGNAGSSLHGTNINCDINDFEAVKQTAYNNNIKIVVVGPEVPLVAGIYDYFQEHVSDLIVIGPSCEGALLEGSKEYAKIFMQEFGIPTAQYHSFTHSGIESGKEYIATQTPPVVLKADGLAAGKGVLICNSVDEAQHEFEQMLAGKFGDASSKVVVEQFLKGIEFSVFVLTDGDTYKILPVAKDYKRIGEGDTGLNTGGMGSISPVPFVDEVIMQKVEDRIIRPTIAGIRQRGIIYKGFIFFGLILVNDDPFVIEYNCRLGDPETQVVLPRLKNDLVEILLAIHNGSLKDIDIEKDAQCATAIIAVSGGYPGSYEKGKVISGLDNIDGSLLFHAGTKMENEKVLTNGGRVLAITSLAENMQDAIQTSLQNMQRIYFEGMYYRKDIGQDVVKLDIRS